MVVTKVLKNQWSILLVSLDIIVNFACIEKLCNSVFCTKAPKSVYMCAIVNCPTWNFSKRTKFNVSLTLVY